MLVTIDFSFSHTVFHSYISLVRQNAVLCNNGLIAAPCIEKEKTGRNFLSLFF